MYEFYYDNVTSIRFYPIIEDLKYIFERDDENPFIIRESLVGTLLVSESDFDFFEPFKGTSEDITGTFKEVISGTKSYSCTFVVNNDINYTTKFLKLSISIKDKYSLIIDSPELNLDTEFDIVDELPSTAPISIKNVGSTKELFSCFSLIDIVNTLVPLIDNTILTDNTDTYAALDTENYKNCFFNNVRNIDNETKFNISLSQIFDFLSFNSGLNFFAYIDATNTLIFDYIDNIAQGAYSLDLTNYNSINWAEQKPLNVSFETKLSKITYSSIYSTYDFRSIDCIFKKNKRNEIINEYLFITDLDQTEEETNGKQAINTNIVETTLNQGSFVGFDFPFDIFSSSVDGRTVSGETTTPNEVQYADNGITFNFSKNQELIATWNGGFFQYFLEIRDSTTTALIHSVALDVGTLSYKFDAPTGVRFRISGSLNPEEGFSITNLTFKRVDYIIDAISSVDNKAFSPLYIAQNYLSNMPDSEGTVNGTPTTGISKKPAEVEEIEFLFDGLLSSFDFSKYVKTSLSTLMIPYRIERTILNLDEKGFDKLTLKKR
jgi:hypothetical protein